LGPSAAGRFLTFVLAGGYEFGFLLLTPNFKSKPGSGYPAAGMLFSHHRQYPIVICNFEESIVEVLL